MKEQDKHQLRNGSKGLESKEGEQQRLSCNSAVNCFPSLENTNSVTVSDTMLTEQLAKILVDIFMEHKRNEYKRQKEGGHLL